MTTLTVAWLWVMLVSGWLGVVARLFTMGHEYKLTPFGALLALLMAVWSTLAISDLLGWL